jgi:hypothetical protein
MLDLRTSHAHPCRPSESRSQCRDGHPFVPRTITLIGYRHFSKLPHACRKLTMHPLWLDVVPGKCSPPVCGPGLAGCRNHTPIPDLDQLLENRGSVPEPRLSENCLLFREGVDLQFALLLSSKGTETRDEYSEDATESEGSVARNARRTLPCRLRHWLSYGRKSRYREGSAASACHWRHQKCS